MLSRFYQLFSQKIQLIFSHSKWAVILLLLVLSVSCSSSKPPEIALKLNVQAAGRPGVYDVSGATDLPNQSEISVAAIRYLRPKSDNFLETDTNATYSILDRQIVPIKQGKWQATLNLWQVASDGRFQEAWQLGSSETGLSVDPASEVSFVATFDPTGQLLKPKQQGIDPQNLRGSLVRFTSEGVPYVQASQTLQVSLPTGRRSPPQLKAEDINGGWGDRYKLPSEPPVASRIPPQQFSTSQTNAPLSPSEFLR
jgi:hypothetical protein